MVNGYQATFSATLWSDDGVYISKMLVCATQCECKVLIAHAFTKFSYDGKSLQGLCNMSLDLYYYYYVLLYCVLKNLYIRFCMCMTQYIWKPINPSINPGSVRYDFF